MPQLDKFTYFTQFFWSCIQALSLQFLVSFSVSLLFIFLEESFLRHKKAIIGSETFLYFLLICWVFFSLFLFCWFYPLVVGEVAAGGLVNPLQVLVQLCAVIFFRDYPKKIYFILLSLFGGSLFANLFLTGVENLYLYLFSLLFIFSFVLLLGNKSYNSYIFLFLYIVGFNCGPETWKIWGFYLAFQQVGYHVLSLILRRGRGPTEPLFIFLFLTFVQLLSILLFNFNDDSFLSDPLLLQKLAALLSGACMILIGLDNRRDWGWLFPFFSFVALSYYNIAPGPTPGIYLFIICHLMILFFIFLVKQLVDNQNSRVAPLLLIFFSLLLPLSPFCPEIAWMKTWLEGLSLLLQALGIVSLFEGGERESKPKPECKSKSNQKNSRCDEEKDKEKDGGPQSPLDQFAIVPFIPMKEGKLYFSFTNSSFYLLLTLSFVLFVFYLVTKKGGGKSVSNGFQSVLELIYDFVPNLVNEQIGGLSGNVKQKYFPCISVTFTFSLFRNLQGMIPYSFTVTSHFIVTLGLSFSLFIGITIVGFVKNGLHFLSFSLPAGVPLPLAPFLVLLELIPHCFRALSLGIRLFANIMAGHSLVKILSGFAWTMLCMNDLFYFIGSTGVFFIVLALTGLELGVAILQAYVFTILICIYLNDAINLH